MNEEYTPTIGLEIHAELKTKTKMFCYSRNNPDEKEPNKNICPVCTGHPGTLPTINKEAVRHILKIGLAVKGEWADFTEFDRKNYFYPDIPKGYQISQYKFPLVKGGAINEVKLTRIHLEEDTATSMHDRGNYSLVDFNRAGLPLMELVTEPVIHSAKEAGDFARELQLLLRYLDVAEANMEKGEMRVEANISVSATNQLGTKVEVKNLNSFKSVEKAIDFEISRHIKILEGGEKVVQETRGWDENKEETFSQRIKEESHDYRYFPEPDLPKLHLSKIPEFSRKVLETELPELPWERRERYKSSFGIKEEDAEMYVRSAVFSEFFEAVSKELEANKDAVKLASNYISSDIAGLMKSGEDEVKEWLLKDNSPQAFAKLILMAKEGKISSRGAKDILAVLVKEDGDPEKITEEKNLLQKSDGGELKAVVQKIITDNPKVVEEYKSGKESVLQFLVGQGMKETKGSANPKILKDLFVEALHK